MNHKALLFLPLLAATLQSQAQSLIKPKDSHIRYEGRIAITDSTAELSWSATSVSICFSGTRISAVLKDERNDNNYNVVIDGKVFDVIHPDIFKKTYRLAYNLKPGKHTVELFKRTEWAMGKTWFYGFELYGENKVLPLPAEKKHKIEFYGNSITCGYAVEDTTGKDRGTSPYENAWVSYASITARHFDAELYSISKSGIGVTVSWFPLVMPEMYGRLDATDPYSKWNFVKYKPELVVINLFQNDCWIVNLPDNEQFKARFGKTKPTEEFIVKAYRKFVETVRSKYPEAKIICTLGSMDATKAGSPWPGYIEKAVSGIGDKNIYTHIITYKNTNGHPSVKEQQAMADNLISFVHEKIGW